MTQRTLPLLTAVLLALPAGLAHAQDTTTTPPKPKSAEDRIQDMETRLQALERAMVEKDARIADLQRQLQQTQSGRPQMPGFTFQLNPQEMEQFQERMNDYLRRNLDGLFLPRPGQDFGDEEPFDLRRGFDRDLGPRNRQRAQKPRLGVSVDNASDELRARFKNEAESGAFVLEVVPQSAAEKAGLALGDCIVEFDKQPVRTALDLITMLRDAPVGVHDLKIMRRGEKIDLAVTLAAPQPNEPERPAVRRRGDWLELEREPNRGVHERVEIKTSHLELPASLEQELKLSAAQKDKMAAVLAKHLTALNQEYATRGDRPMGFNPDGEVRELLRKHVKAAEADLAATLDEQQIAAWRRWREANQDLSISRKLSVESQGPVTPHDDQGF
ncbi:MAG: PDZ domain-containing protein [Planctomycetes bacterium]|nr:PDZ domain-containing protein [Planctomycetota bacterium]